MIIATLKKILPPGLYAVLHRNARNLIGAARERTVRNGLVKLHGVTLDISDPNVSPTIRRYVLRGHYESHEVRLAKRLLHPEDRVLELGTGMGFLTIICAKIVGAQNVYTFEANPQLESLIRSHFSLNAVEPVLDIAILGDGYGEETFFVNQDFFASSALDETRGDAVIVPRKDFKDTVSKIAPTVLLMDIEGAECDIVEMLEPGSLRRLIIECHPDLAGHDRIKAMISRLENLGFQTQIEGDPNSQFQLIGLRDV